MNLTIRDSNENKFPKAKGSLLDNPFLKASSKKNIDRSSFGEEKDSSSVGVVDNLFIQKNNIQKVSEDFSKKVINGSSTTLNKSTPDSLFDVAINKKRSDVPIPRMPIRRASNRISVNLVPEDTLRIVKELLPVRLKYLALWLVVTFGLLMILWGGVSWFQLDSYASMQALRGDINENESRIHVYTVASSEIVKLRERYEHIKLLLAQHVYWSNFFIKLEKYTLPDVYYTSFSVKSDPGARITLNSRALSVESVARQLEIFNQADDFLVEARINGFSSVSNAEQHETESGLGDLISFDIIMTLRDDVFTSTP